MRLFIAIPIAEVVKEQLADLHQPLEGVRWQKKGQMHLTLKFLGETTGERFQELLAELQKVGKEAFSMTLQGLGYFPQGKHPRVLWVGVEQNEALLDLQQRVEEVCAGVGFEPEKRSFTPHVTIGRVNGGSKSDVMSFINQHKQFKVPGIPVESFVLYESKLSAEGAKHHRRKIFHLNPKE